MISDMDCIFHGSAFERESDVDVQIEYKFNEISTCLNVSRVFNTQRLKQFVSDMKQGNAEYHFNFVDG